MMIDIWPIRRFFRKSDDQTQKMDKNGKKTVLMNPLFEHVVVVVYVLFVVEVVRPIL